MMYDIAVFIGRFAPFHNGHKAVIDTALINAKEVVVLVGSSNRVLDPRTPWSAEARRSLIRQAYGVNPRLSIVPIEDFMYDDVAWVDQIHKLVDQMTAGIDSPKIALIGFNKDDTSYYLKKFPNWGMIDVEGYVRNDSTIVDSSDTRKFIFSEEFFNDRNRIIESKLEKNAELSMIVNLFEPIRAELPWTTILFLSEYVRSKKYLEMYEEFRYNENYSKEWPNDPHLTVDAVVVQANHVLLVERKFNPGKGLLALPGGFVDKRERFEDAAIRELKEETNIDIPPGVLKSQIVASRCFDHPYRSLRARIVTFAYLFDLNNEIKRKLNMGFQPPVGLTKVRGGDDAASAKWVKIDELRKNMMFEDHYDIIMKMLTYME